MLRKHRQLAYIASVELAPGKARTAALFKKPSQALEDAINDGRIAAVTAHGYIEMQGGLPIVVDGQVIGGIGASFDTPEHDVQIARAGLAALNRWTTGDAAQNSRVCGLVDRGRVRQINRGAWVMDAAVCARSQYFRQDC